MRTRASLPVLLCGLALAAPSRAQQDDPAFQAWRGPTAPATSPEDPPPDPVDLQPEDGLDLLVSDLIRRGQWVDVALALARAGDGPGFVRGTTPGAGLIGMREDVRRRVLRLPQPARDAYHALAEARAQSALRSTADRREVALADVLDRWSGDGAISASAARLLGERLLERGDVGGAALLWRRSLEVQPDRRLEARLMSLRAHLGLDRVGSLTASTGQPRAFGVRWARRAPGGDQLFARPVLADGSRVYLTDTRGVLALDREDGRLLWRVALRGDPRHERLALGLGRLLLARRDRLLLIDAATGALVWERRIEHLLPPGQPAKDGKDRLLDAASTPAGFVVLATLDGERVLLGVAPEGRLAFETRLWQEHGTDSDNANGGIIQPRRPEYVLRRAGERDEQSGEQRREDTTEVLTPPAGPARRVMEDGRLAAIGDRVMITADGLVASASALTGGLLWLREWSLGREVAGNRVLVDITAGPYAVEAVTAMGALVRLDPLDGTSLCRPEPPAQAREAASSASPAGRRDADPDEPPYVVAASPLVLAWPLRERPGDPASRVEKVWLTSGERTRVVMHLALGPLGPGAVCGQTLCFPDGEGVALVDLMAGDQGTLPWILAPGPLVATGGLLVAAGPEGLVVYGPVQGDEPKEPAPVELDGPAALAALDSADWRLRLRGYDALARRAAAATPDLERGARGAATAEARDVARELLDQVDRRRVFSSLPTKSPVPSWLMTDLVRGVSLPERLRWLRDLVSTGSRGSPELERHLLAAEDPQVRQALFEILLRIDGGLRKRVGRALSDPREPRELRVACGRALVTLAATGGTIEPLQRAVGDMSDGSFDVEVAQLVLEAGQTTGNGDVLTALLPQLSIQQPNPAAPEPEDEAGDAPLIEAIPRLLEESER